MFDTVTGSGTVRAAPAPAPAPAARRVLRANPRLFLIYLVEFVHRVMARTLHTPATSALPMATASASASAFASARNKAPGVGGEQQYNSAEESASDPLALQQFSHQLLTVFDQVHSVRCTDTLVHTARVSISCYYVFFLTSSTLILCFVQHHSAQLTVKYENVHIILVYCTLVQYN